MTFSKKFKRTFARFVAFGPLLGCDVSSYQGVIDWKQLASSKYFAFIRATDGAHFVDKYFSTNWKAAKANGVVRGAYHYFRPAQDVAEQIQNFCAAVGSLKPGDLPPVLDIEDPAQWTSIEESQRVQLVLQWLQGVEQVLGVKPMIYCSPSFVSGTLGATAAQVLSSYRLWIANYTTGSQPIVPAPWTVWTFWQYSDTGSVPGITGAVDLDVFSGSLGDLVGHLVPKLSKKDKKRRKKDQKKKDKTKHDKNKSTKTQANTSEANGETAPKKPTRKRKGKDKVS